MISQKIRKEFLQFFKKHGHKIVPSSSVVPHNDPTLLFINAGMNQFKDIFLGKVPTSFTRASSSQKCIRVGGKHNDLDNVGHTARHMTFFEMLGNFSFGDYFKEKAIEFAFDLTMNGFNFPKEKLFVSVYEEDDETFELWKKHMPEKQIVRMGKKDNFWMMGDTGPCGPCTELYFDKGAQFGSARNPLEDKTGERFLEFWNIVFMEFELALDGSLSYLPCKNVDTGAGLERVVSIVEGVDSVFQIDLFRELISQIENVLHVKYNPHDQNLAPAFHVISDHIRSLSFAIADGAQPGNIERGYVLRKLLRRAVRYGRKLGAEGPFLGKILPKLVDLMGEDFPELKTSSLRIDEIITLEEESFIRTLKKGGNILANVIKKAEETSKKEISGEDAFKLKDTYGFPLEEILLLAKDSHLHVNLDAYTLLEEEAKERSKKSKETHLQKFEQNEFESFAKKHGASEFVGYTEVEAEASILEILHNGKPVSSLKEGQEGLVLLDKTPFYAEKGGQICDIGDLTHKGAHFVVESTMSPHPDLIVHKGVLKKGTLLVGEPVVAKIDVKRRHLIENNHSATHLLHYALEKVLGSHIKQAGSLVEVGRLRFDFNHHKPLSQEELKEVEKIVNEKIQENGSVKTYEMSYEEVQDKADIKQFFGDKYADLVRVVDISDFSKELCGGTHTSSLGRLALFKILKESSIASGVRRIEAVTAKAALEHINSIEEEIESFAKKLDSPVAAISSKLDHVLEECKNLRNTLKRYKTESANNLIKDLSHKTHKEKDLSYLCALVDIEPADLSSFSNTLSSTLKETIILLAIKHDGKCQLLLKVPESLAQRGIKANLLMKELAPLVSGSGGGKDLQAQAGGTNPSGIEQAFEKFKQLLKAC